MNMFRREVNRLRARLKKSLNDWDLIVEHTGLEKSRLSSFCGFGDAVSIADAILISDALDAMPTYSSLRWYLELGDEQLTRLAEAMRVSPALVSEWADGSRPIPSHRAVELEAQTLGLVKCIRPSRRKKLLKVFALRRETKAA